MAIVLTCAAGCCCMITAVTKRAADADAHAKPRDTVDRLSFLSERLLGDCQCDLHVASARSNALAHAFGCGDVRVVVSRLAAAAAVCRLPIAAMGCIRSLSESRARPVQPAKGVRVDVNDKLACCCCSVVDASAADAVGTVERCPEIPEDRDRTAGLIATGAEHRYQLLATG